jgi:hypothetical protein
MRNTTQTDRCEPVQQAVVLKRKATAMDCGLICATLATAAASCAVQVHVLGRQVRSLRSGPAGQRCRSPRECKCEVFFRGSHCGDPDGGSWPEKRAPSWAPFVVLNLRSVNQPASRSRMRAQLRMPLWKLSRSYFSLGEWIWSSSLPKPISIASVSRIDLKWPAIGIEPPQPT